MLYYIKDNKIITVSDSELTLINYDIVINSNVTNGVFENGEIIEYEKSNKFIEDKTKNQEILDNKSDEINTIEHETKQIEKEFQNSINQFTSDYSQEEINSWSEQKQEAIGILNDEVQDYPIITGILVALNEGKADEDIITSVEYANLVIAKSNMFTIATGKALGIKKRKLKDLQIN